MRPRFQSPIYQESPTSGRVQLAARLKIFLLFSRLMCNLYQLLQFQFPMV